MSEAKFKKNFPYALLGKAQEIWFLAQEGKISKYKAKKILNSFKSHYPEGIDNFNQWYNSPDGLGFRKWISEK